MVYFRIFQKIQHNKKLEDNETNIRYVAAYLRYWIDEWSDVLDISNMPDILATLFNVGVHAKAPNSHPTANNFGKSVAFIYDYLKKVLYGE